MFVAASLMGSVSWWLLKQQAKYLMKKYIDPTTEAAKNAQIVGGYIFYSIHFLLCLLFLLWSYNSFYWDAAL